MMSEPEKRQEGDSKALNLALALSLWGGLKDDVSGPDEQGRYLHTFKIPTDRRWTFSIEQVEEVAPDEGA